MSKNFELIARSAACGSQRALVEKRTALPPRQPRSGSSHDQEILPLVRELFLAPASRHVTRSVFFVSVDASGRSGSICVRAAKALASLDVGTVCLVDANRSCPSMLQVSGFSQDPGVADQAQPGGGTRFMTHEVEPGLWLLPAGRRTTEAGAGTPLDHLEGMTRDLRDSFDWVLADIGPIGPAGAPPTVARSADGVVLVLAANHTRRAVALRAKQDIVAAGGRVLGAVLTDRTYPIPEAIYRRL